MDIKMKQGERLTITFEDDENPLTGEVTFEFTDSYISANGWGYNEVAKEHGDKIKFFVKR